MVKQSKQYGLVHKEVIQNNKISVKAKGLYVYLVSRSGNKYTCHPTVKTILNDLDICETTFHKLKKELIKHKVISITKVGSGINKRNKYNLLNKSADGYGIVYLDVLTDSNLNLTAKAIYGLLASYGTSKVAYPLVSLICKLLGITKNTYYKYSKLLKNKGVLKTEQLHKEGRYSNCNYYINGLTSSDVKTEVKENKEQSTKSENKLGYTDYEEQIKGTIDYKALINKYNGNKTAKVILENTVNILTNTIYFKSKGIVVNGIEVTNERLSMVYNKLNFKHVVSVIENILKVGTTINNIVSYLKVSLYNIYYDLKNANRIQQNSL